MVLKPNVGILGFPDPLIVYLVMGCWVCNFQKRTSFCTEKIYRQKLKKLDNNVAICLIVKLCCNGSSSPPKMTCHPTWWEISESSSITRFCSFTKLTSGSLLPFLHCSSSLNAWLKMKLSTATFSLYLNSSSWEDFGSCHIFPMFVIELNRIGDCLMSRWLPLLRSSNMLSRRFWSFCRWSMPIIVVKKIFWKWRGRRGRREASNSSNSLVVVCSSLSIQNSIWRVSGLFKLNFWSVSCPNSSRQAAADPFCTTGIQMREDLNCSSATVLQILPSFQVVWPELLSSSRHKKGVILIMIFFYTCYFISQMSI